MTDEQIIKGLECCADESVEICKECPYFVDTFTCNQMQMRKDALDLINRQKAELENQSENFKRLVAEHRKLQTDNSSMQSTLAKMSMGVEQAKAEAIKEFAERLKDNFPYKNACYTFEGIEYRIDNLVKEMVGDTE